MIMMMMMTMMPFPARIMLIKILALIVLQGVLASPLKSERASRSLPGSKMFASRDSQLTEGAKTRQKRCTCYSYTDKECVYYCHLDIIWINTPERTVPYGMSSYMGQPRRRRAVGGWAAERDGSNTPRCVCAVADEDPGCQDFCLSKSRQTLSSKSLHRVPGLG